MLSQTEENYLKAIFHIVKKNGKSASTNKIAQKLNTKASSVTDMIQKLSDKNLVNYVKYQGTSLTTEGKQTAVKIIRRHRLWEVFLVDKLNYNWDEVHVIAEQLEHIKSDTLIDRLEDYLNYPTKDPHGDPIPTKDGEISQKTKTTLADIAEGNKCTVTGVKDSAAFLQYLNKINIQLGSEIMVISKQDFDQSLLIEVNNKTISISNKISINIFVKKLKK